MVVSFGELCRSEKLSVVSSLEGPFSHSVYHSISRPLPLSLSLSFFAFSLYLSRSFCQAILYGLEVVLAVISLLLLFNASLKASRGFFKVMLKGVLGANMRFHDTVSRGRLLNRFAGDMESMDEELAQSLNDLITTAFDLLIHLGVVWYTNGIRFVVLFAVILPAYVWAGIAYASATRELRRLESTTKSPILSAFTDLVGGVTVIRAFGAQAHTLEVLIKRT